MDTFESGYNKQVDKSNNGSNKRSKVRQGVENRLRILETIKAFPVITSGLIQYETDIELKTIQNQLTRLATARLIVAQRRGLGEEYLYRWKGLKAIKLQAQAHMLHCAEVWAALRKGVPNEWAIEEGLLKEFTSSYGTVIPDRVFTLRHIASETKLCFTWEEDLNSMRGKDECLDKYRGMWQWRKEHCYDTKGENRWGIKNIMVLTSAPENRRMQELRETARAAQPDGLISKMFLFSSRQKWSLQEPEKLYSDIWVSVKDDAPRFFWK